MSMPMTHHQPRVRCNANSAAGKLTRNPSVDIRRFLFSLLTVSRLAVRATFQLAVGRPA